VVVLSSCLRSGALINIVREALDGEGASLFDGVCTWRSESLLKVLREPDRAPIVKDF